MPHPATTLRALLRDFGKSSAIMAPGAFNAMTAKLAERVGFPAVYVPGGGTALASFGVADVGLLTLNEMVANAAAIAEAVSIPVIADADTGFGNQINAQRTVREYERAGVAAIHIEDQEFPKRCGFFNGKRLIPTPEAAAKIRAAVAARSNPDFMIIARCDALSVGGIDDVAHRCKAYLAAGADMLFVEGGGRVEQIRDMPKLIGGDHLFNMSASGKVPSLTADEAGRLGYKLMIFPNFATLAAIRATSAVYESIMTNRSIAQVDQHCASFSEFTELGDARRFRAIEQEFGS